MISKTQIRYMANSSSYSKGAELYATGKVLDMDVKNMGASDEIVASVKGSGRNIYEVDVSIDTENDEVDTCYCECRAYAEYGGLCKHCVAVLLQYNDYENDMDSYDYGQSVEKIVKGGLTHTIRKGVQMHTTPELASLLQKQAVAKSLPLIQGSTYGKVRLEPYFNFDGRTFTVEFKIGINKMYVLKDAFSFDVHIANQDDYKYGKNLQFVHTIESFAEESRPLAKFICKWADNNRQFHRSSSYYGYYMGTLEKVRHLDLSGNELAEFLLLMEGKTLQGESIGTRNTTWEITREHLPRKMTITGAKQGIELKVSKFTCVANTEQYKICFYDKKIYIENVEELLPVKDFLDSLSLIPGEKAFIENKDVPAFCQELLPVIQKFFKCRMVEFHPENYGMVKPEFRFYLDAPQENMVTCKATVKYGDREFSLYTTDDIAARDMNRETVVRNVIHKYSNAFNPFEQCAVIADDEEMEYEFLTEGIQALQAVGEVFISDALRRIEVRNSPKVTVGVSLSGNLLELSMTAGDISKEELIDILSRYNKKKKFYRLKNGAFVNAADSGLDTVEELRAGLQLTDKQMKQDKIEVQKYRALYLDAQLKENPVVSAVKDKSFKSLVRNMKTIEDNDFEVPESLDKVLREYQKRGFLWIKTLNYNGFGGILAGLQLTDKQMKQDKIEVQKYRALYLDAQLKENPVVSAVKDKSFKSLVRNMKTIEDNDFEVPESLDKVLREYQKRGFLWIKTLNYNGFGGILADDMGLGKTLQVIAFLLSEFLERRNTVVENIAVKETAMLNMQSEIETVEQACKAAEAQKADGKKADRQTGKLQRNTLIIAPASLVYNWSSEIQRFAPELTAKMVTGTAAERRQILAEADSEDILLTSYDLLKRDISEYEGYKFRCEIIDEAQYIKNANTQAAKAVKEVQADFRLALTGTPVENRLSELWSIFDYLMPGFLYSYKKFREEVEIPAVQNSDEDAMKRLQKMIRPFVLRRLKKEVLTDLPDKLEENMFVQLTGEQQKLYDAHVKRMMLMLDKQSEEEFKTSKITILAELTKLRQICCDPSLIFADYKADSAKVDMCLNMISNAVESGHKILLFSQFTTMLDHLAKRLEEEKISYYMLTGSTSKEKRAQMVENFNTDDTQVFCISLKAGGTGLNLTAADIVIHFDPWWNLAVQNQATDRAHRIGQKNVVNVYKLIVKDTIEENILKLQEKKRELADQILEGEGLNGGSFTKEELMELLSGK